ncbi:MAG: 3-to-5 exoribonuclease RNase [Pseudomonadota bacterium]
MAKKPHDMTGAERLPTREALLEWLKGAGGAKNGKREIAKAFGIKGSGRIALKAMIKDLEAEGALEKRGRALVKPGHLPPITMVDVTSRDRDGDLVARPVEWNEATQGKPPRIILVTGGKKRPGQPAPTVGDRALARVEVANDNATLYRGRPVRILERHKAQTLGQFRQSPHGGGRVLPIDKKSLGREIMIPPGQEGDATDGDLVAVSLHRKNRLGLIEGRVTERVGSIKTEKAVSLIAIHTHQIPHVFPATALAEADASKPATLAGPGKREDWRKVEFVTIDPADAKDHDDAVHAMHDPDPKNKDGFLVSVAIADVAAYVHEGSSMDREARLRGNSVYFPDRVVPMLPERISNDLCSLRPDEDRAALAIRLVIGADGRVRQHTLHRILMRSHAKLAYEKAQAIMDADERTHEAYPWLKILYQAWNATREERRARNPLDLDLPERKLKLNANGAVERVYVPARLDAHRLIEDFMILANVAAAEILERAQAPLIYRVHDEPSAEKRETLRAVLADLGTDLPKGERLTPMQFNRILEKFRDTEHQIFINEIVLRSQAQAEYSPQSIGHFGLNLRRYAHFTSPIRRYADLIVHRALIRSAALGSDGLSERYMPQLAEISAEISATERRAMAAERETIDRLIAFHLHEKIGDIFEGRIAGVTRSGLFVKLHETGADGFVPASTIGADYYRFEEQLHALVGTRTGETFRLGDTVSVRLVEAAPVAGALRFEILTGGSSGSGSGNRLKSKGIRKAKKGPRISDVARAANAFDRKLSQSKRRRK